MCTCLFNIKRSQSVRSVRVESWYDPAPLKAKSPLELRKTWSGLDGVSPRTASSRQGLRTTE
ncbi:MAG: hypothetical protein F6K26_03670 [Moorea sp. SIO2I5]|nr:hypothetical protein [Moorena sp. SIO2I5]